MKANQNRLSILTQSEIQDYFGIPRLTQEDREDYFELADNEVKLIGENWPLHSSSDGQRFETQINTINARHASKYFGLKKGISALTLIGNHVPINAKVIGTHEHESYFVFDLLYNNTTDIDPDRHSVDTHGTNQVNFWILHAFGYQFAPGTAIPS